jgi:hypothetical protein
MAAKGEGQEEAWGAERVPYWWSYSLDSGKNHVLPLGGNLSALHTISRDLYETEC